MFGFDFEFPAPKREAPPSSPELPPYREPRQSEEERAAIFLAWLREITSGELPLLDKRNIRLSAISKAVSSNARLGVAVESVLRAIEVSLSLARDFLSDYYRAEERRRLFPRWALAGRLPNPHEMREAILGGVPALTYGHILSHTVSPEAEAEWREMMQRLIRDGLCSAVGRHPPTIRVANSWQEWDMGADISLFVEPSGMGYWLRQAELAGGIVPPGTTFDILSEAAHKIQSRPLLHADGSPIDANGKVVLYHTTYKQTAETMLRDGIRFGEKRRWNPKPAGSVRSLHGNAVGDGIYLSAIPGYGLGVYGDTTMEVRVKVADLAVGPQRDISFWRGLWTPLGSLAAGSGYTEVDISPSDVGRLGDMPKELTLAWPAGPPMPILCSDGAMRWGPYGAAGILFKCSDRYYLVLRGAGTQEGGTWGIPGGAIDRPGESPLEAAYREAREEVGYHGSGTVVWSWEWRPCKEWAYTTFVVEAEHPFRSSGLDWETAGEGWFTAAEIDGLHLHPGFRAALPHLV